MNLSIKIDTRKLRQMDAATLVRANDLLDLTAEGIANEARRLAPVDTGALRNSIHVERGTFSRTIADGVEYGVYQEFGARGRAARPFLTPAFEMFRSTFLKAWKVLTE